MLMKKNARKAVVIKIAKSTKPRNPVARSPLLRKGGAHQKSEQALRKRAKDELAQALRRKDED